MKNCPTLEEGYRVYCTIYHARRTTNVKGDLRGGMPGVLYSVTCEQGGQVNCVTCEEVAKCIV